MQKIALITGANKGIGQEIARQLGKQNIQVLIGSRDLKNGQRATEELRSQTIDATALQLDVTNAKSVKHAAAFIQQNYGRLDILVNNAGTIVNAEFGAIQTVAFEQTYAVNVFGLVRVTEAMLPLLKQSTSGRIINLTSGLASFTATQDPNNEYSKVLLPAYNSSKTAVNAITVQFAKILQKDGIAINAVDPGFSDTDMNNHTGTRPVTESAKTIVWLALLDNSSTGKFYHDQEETAW